MLPLKFARRWSWENLWLIFTLVSMAVLPWLMAVILVDRLGSVYATVGIGQMTLPFLLGAGWGIAQILFGLSVARLGLALAYAVIIGLGSVGGTLVPIILRDPAVLVTPKGALILIGLSVMVAGIAVSARAGSQREEGIPRAAGSGYTAALALAILCGLMAPMINYAFAFGQAIANRAVDLGSTPVHAAYAVWPIALAGGLLPNLGYSAFRLFKNGTWSVFRESAVHDSSLAVLMGMLWMGAFAVYGVSSVYLGKLGTSVGWGLFQIFMIITANSGGLLVGEWRDAPVRARSTLYGGLALLVVATLLLAAVNR
jgi:L-rhamnose-H+ transport protein